MADPAELAAQGWPEVVRTLRDLGCSPGGIGAAVMSLGRGETAREALRAMRRAEPTDLTDALGRALDAARRAA